MSWQPLAEALTPVPDSTCDPWTEHCGAVRGLSRYCARLTVRLVPAMRPSMRTGRRVAIGGDADDSDLDLEGVGAALGLDRDGAGRALLGGGLRLEDDLAPTGTGLAQVDPVDGRVPRRLVLRAAAVQSGRAATRGRGAGCRTMRAGPSAASCTSWSGQRRTGTSGPIWTGIVTYAVWAALSPGPVAFVTSSMRAAGPT